MPIMGNFLKHIKTNRLIQDNFIIFIEKLCNIDKLKSTYSGQLKMKHYYQQAI